MTPETLDTIFLTIRVLSPLWPVYLLIILALIFRWAVVDVAREARLMMQLRKSILGERLRTNSELLRWLQSMTPTEFEQYITDLYYRLGFTVKHVGGWSDKGIDVIAKKDSVVHYIQCKKTITARVTVNTMRDFYGAIADAGTKTKGVFITTTYFTDESIKFANERSIQLIDAKALLKLIDTVRKD